MSDTNVLPIGTMVYVQCHGNTQIGYIKSDCGNNIIHVVCMIDGKEVMTETLYELVEKVLKD